MLAMSTVAILIVPRVEELRLGIEEGLRCEGAREFFNGLIITDEDRAGTT
jgi:hypothetical protein